MIKRTLYFGNPAYLSFQNKQLVINIPSLQDKEDKGELNTIPIEDIGVLILDNQQITFTQVLLSALLENNTAVISCDASHHPTGLFLPLDVHTVQSEKFRSQIEASLPLKKNLWQQTIQSKINNQAAHLQRRNVSIENMIYWSASVKSGDPDNYEARAAAYYWKNLFPAEMSFFRERSGAPPNNLLNYGYAILRAMTARALVGSGLLPTFGIHHRNKYNAYCLADDIMEPYRPYIDVLVADIVDTGEEIIEITKSLKAALLSIASRDVRIGGEKSPLMNALQRTSASLARCYEGETRKISYPVLE